MKKQKTQKTEKSLEDWSEEYMVCNEFTEAYKEENPEAVIKYGVTKEGDVHCYIYDPEKNQTLDPTLEQFHNYENGSWDGDEHPHVKEIEGFNSIDKFKEEFFSQTALERAEKIQ